MCLQSSFGLYGEKSGHTSAFYRWFSCNLQTRPWQAAAAPRRFCGFCNTFVRISKNRNSKILVTIFLNLCTKSMNFAMIKYNLEKKFRIDRRGLCADLVLLPGCFCGSFLANIVCFCILYIVDNFKTDSLFHFGQRRKCVGPYDGDLRLLFLG